MISSADKLTDDIWTVREWYNYGRWNRYVRETFHFRATSRKHALEQYHATSKPKYSGAKITACKY